MLCSYRCLGGHAFEVRSGYFGRFSQNSRPTVTHHAKHHIIIKIIGRVAWRVTHATCDIQRLESRLNSGNGSAFKSSSISPPCAVRSPSIRGINRPRSAHSSYRKAEPASLVSPHFLNSLQRFFVCTWSSFIISSCFCKRRVECGQRVIFGVRFSNYRFA